MNSTDWTKISNDPSSFEVYAALKNELGAKQIPACFDRIFYFAQLAEGKSVLDIGIVEHGHKYWDSTSWMHRYLHKSADKCLGIDIDENGISNLKKRGYSVQVANATSDIFLGSTFDVIVAGEVLEHISRLESFFDFCSRHAHAETKLLLSSPNPHYIWHMCKVLREGMCMQNAEHVAWLSPINILELCRRTSP